MFQYEVKAKRVLEKDFDSFCRDINYALAALDCIYNYGLYDESEYAGDYDEPAGIINGRLLINVDTDDSLAVIEAIRSTTDAYNYEFQEQLTWRQVTLQLMSL